MRNNLFERLKTIVRFADIIDTPIAASGEADPDVPYQGHEGELVVIADDGLTMTFDKRKYDVVCFYPGTIPNGQLVLRFPFGRKVEFPAGLTGSEASLGTAATGETILSFKKNGVEFATCTFEAAGTTGTFSCASDVTFNAGDVLTVHGPESGDATAADLGFTLDGEKKV